MAIGYSLGGLIKKLGAAAFLNVGKSSGQVAAGDDSRIVGAASKKYVDTTYLPLSGGSLSGPLEIVSPSVSVAQKLVANSGTSVYQEFYVGGSLVTYVGYSESLGTRLVDNKSGQQFIMRGGRYYVGNNEIATTNQLFLVGQKYVDVTSQRNNRQTYQNTTSSPLVVYIETNRIGNKTFSIDITCDGERVAYHWTESSDNVMSLMAVIPPGSYFRVNGGWAAPTEWVVIAKWKESTLR